MRWSTCQSRPRWQWPHRSPAPGEKALADQRGVNPEGSAGAEPRVEVWASEKRKRWWCLRGEGEGEPNLIPPLPPPLPLPGYFLESCISVATFGADTLGGLSADAGARKRVFPAWPLAAEEPPAALPPGCHSPGRLTRLPVAPAAPPGTGWFLLEGHILSRRRSLPLPPNTHPFLFFLSTRFCEMGGGGVGGHFSGPFNRAFEAASK